MKTSGAKHLTYTQRLQLYEYLQKSVDKKLIAAYLNCSLATIYREIERGSTQGIYNPDYSQEKYEQSKAVKRKQEKLYIDGALAQRIADLIRNENLSPEKAIKKLKEQNVDCPTKTTIYSAIDKGLIPNVRREDLHSKTTTMFSHGLIQIPTWMREKLNLHDGDSMMIAIQDNRIVLEKNCKV